MLLAFAGGDGRPEPIDQLDATRWRSVIDSNLTATYITVRTFALGMTERRRGSIVTMSSTAGRQPGGASVAYAAAKAGIVMLTRHLANDLAPYGVRINCIAPSAIETERLVRLMPAAAREQLGQSFPLRRLGTVDDVADTALYLATAQVGLGDRRSPSTSPADASRRDVRPHRQSPYGVSTTFRASRRSNSS